MSNECIVGRADSYGAGIFDMYVSPGFRADLLNRVPDLQAGSNLRLFQGLVWPLFMDDWGVVLPVKALHQMIGSHHKGISGNDHLESLRKALEPSGIVVDVGEYCYLHGRARTVSITLPDDIQNMVDEETRNPARWSERVSLVSGEQWNRRTHYRNRRNYEMALLAEADPGHPAAELLRYLNSCPTRALEMHVTDRLDVAHDWLDSQPEDKPREQRKNVHARAMLRRIEQKPWSRYKPVERSARLFADGCGFAMLPRDLRKILLGGCWELDLKSAQLAIASKVLDCPQLRAFLESGASFWDEIIKWCGCAKSDKPILKRGIYAILFGAQPKTYRSMITDGDGWDEGIGKSAYNRFRSHRLIRELLGRRRVFLNEIKANGGARDAFGKWISTDSREHAGFAGKARSVAAEVMQSYEMRIMLGLVRVLESFGKDIHVMCWLHDGVTVKFRDKEPRKVRMLLKKLVDAVDARIGGEFPTRLEAERLPDVPRPDEYKMAA